MGQAGQVVGKRELIERVWPDVIVEEASLRIHIAALRKVLGDGRDGARYISNVHGRGYCFVAPLGRHSTGGGEVARYVARYQDRVAKAVLIGAVPPIMVKSDGNPGGTPIAVFDEFREQTARNRAKFFLDVPSGPFYGFNRPGTKISQGVINNWWRQGMMGAANAHYDCIKAFSETDFTDDLKKISVPVLVMHGEDDQVVPIADSALLAIKLLKNGTLKTYEGFPHGMATTEADRINVLDLQVATCAWRRSTCRQRSGESNWTGGRGR